MELIELGQRKYRILETSTLEHLLWMDRQILECGLAGLLQESRNLENAGEYAGRVWEAISRSGRVFGLLAGMLLPEEIPDVAWTPAQAEETIALLKKLTAPEEHARIGSMLISLVLGFFGAARDSSALSLAALQSRGRGAVTARAAS